MSNPGVIVLAETKIGNKKNFRVEDNLGEAIHLHYRDIRVDLTVAEFLKLSKICEETFYDLVHADGFDFNDFDGDFLVEHSEKLLYLKKVERQKMPLKDLYYLSRRYFVPVNKRVVDENEQSWDCYMNAERGTPVLFNDGNVLISGTALVKKAVANKEKNIEILRMYFEDYRYSVPEKPWVNYLFRWNKSRIKGAVHFFIDLVRGK